jgi:hypothetical protein
MLAAPLDEEATWKYRLRVFPLLATTLVLLSWTTLVVFRASAEFVDGRGVSRLWSDPSPDSCSVISGSGTTVYLTVGSFDAASAFLRSSVQVELPYQELARLVGNIEGTSWPAGVEAQLVVDRGLAFDQAAVTPMTRLNSYQSERAWIGPLLSIESQVAGFSPDFPLDKYTTDANVRLALVWSDGSRAPLPVPVKLVLDCRPVTRNGWQVSPRIDVGPDGDATVQLRLARQAGARWAIFVVALVTATTGGLALSWSRRNPTKGNDSLLTVLGTIALVQARPVIVPNLTPVWTITDRVLAVLICFAASVTLVPRRRQSVPTLKRMLETLHGWRSVLTRRRLLPGDPDETD